MQAQLDAILRQYDPKQVFVIRSARVAYPMPFPSYELEDGEEAKSLTNAEKVWCWLTEQGATRKALLVNIGGGSICDLGGFVAATYLRGIDYINIPTTLLAMVDAAVGGKTAVNLNGLKNRVGAFYPPKSVLTNGAFLRTLPVEEMLSGWGEILKYGLLESADRWHEYVSCMERFMSDCESVMDMSIVDAARKYKERVVSDDLRENGLRKVLNFGHTIGHALEEKTHARHGYCVLWGMVAELYMSVIKAGCPKDVLTQLSRVMLDYYGRPQCNCREKDELVDLMRKDKKNASEEAITFTLLRGVGEPVINQTATVEEIRDGIDYLFCL